MQVVSMIENRTLDSCAHGGRRRRIAHRLFLSRQRSLTLLLAVGFGLSWTVSANALIVGNDPLVVPATNMSPATYYNSPAADPGWNNVTADGSNYVYLGDGWVLSARHVGYSSTAGVKLQTFLPNGDPGPVKSFFRIPGTYYTNYGYPQGNIHHYAVSNQTSISTEGGGSVSLISSVNNYFTDLQLFRISEDPGLPSLTVATQPLPNDFTRANAPEVVTIGAGRNRQQTERYYNAQHTGTDSDGTPHWTWSTASPPPGQYQGYLTTGGYQKRFGTNRIADPHPNAAGDPPDPGAPNDSNLYEAVVSDTRGVFPLRTPDGITRDLIALRTVYNMQDDPGATALESQAIAGNGSSPGNSGSGVFYNRNGQWELIGITNAILRYEDQPTNTSAMYGNSTIISDLSYYNQDYPGSIRNIINTHVNYSFNGDVNLDGVVSGDGTGAWATDDITAFMAGWRFDNGTGVGNLTSWRAGDLNRDGKTNVRDFLLMRAAWNGQLPQVMLTALFGSGSGPPDSVVPEPTAAVLALLGAGMIGLASRRRRPRVGGRR